MATSFLIRTGLVLIPVALVPFCRLLAFISGTEGTWAETASFIETTIPVLFAVAASMTEPNNSRSWQIISTVIVYFTLKHMLQTFAPEIAHRELISCFSSAIITAAFSSHITANTLHPRRYLESRILNLGILLICCVCAVVAVSCIDSVVISLFNPAGESLVTRLPRLARILAGAAVSQLLAPFGADHVTTEFIAGSFGVNADALIVKERLLVFRYCSMAFFLPAMLGALFLKIGSSRKIPVAFLLLAAAVSSFFPHSEMFLLMTLLWLWPGLFCLHALLSSLLLLLCVHLPLLQISGDITSATRILNPVVMLNSGGTYNLMFAAAGAGAYFFATIYLLTHVKIGSLTWKIRKHRGARIRLISDRKDSRDLSLLAIRTMKLAGGIDNIKYVKTEGSLLKIGCYRAEQINEEAVKGMGTNSSVDAGEKTIHIRTRSTVVAERIARKIVIFADREFADLSDSQENEQHAMDTN